MLVLIDEWNESMSHDQTGRAILDIQKKMDELTADILMISDCSTKSKLTPTDHLNLKNIRRKFGVRVGGGRKAHCFLIEIASLWIG